MRHKTRRIQAKKHKFGTYKITKISLPVFDEKRFVLNGDIRTLAYFNKDLKKQVLADKKDLKDFQ